MKGFAVNDGEEVLIGKVLLVANSSTKNKNLRVVVALCFGVMTKVSFRV